MKMLEWVDDEQERQEALNISRSFLIQAPAGSGKTELLIQRILALLATVEQFPPEILAITFTRKAAFEMEQRVLLALLKASQDTSAFLAHEQRTYELAKKALENPRVRMMLETPHCLKIQTIDAFVLGLAAKLPTLTELGTSVHIETESESFYSGAVNRLFDALEETKEPVGWMFSFQRLLLYYDDSMEQLGNLLAALLRRRDQWVPVLSFAKDANWLEQLEKAYQDIVHEVLVKAQSHLEQHSLVRLNDILHYAIKQEVPRAAPSFLSQWKQCAELFITEKGSFRKTVTKQQGFPAASTLKERSEKERLSFYKNLHQEIVEDFKIEGSLEALFASILKFPEPELKAEQKELLQDLLQVLPVLLASLFLEFKANCRVDYTEIILRVVHALDQHECPSVLLESIDPYLRHILVDEFQDTSSIQYRLLELLVEDWRPGDGRTLFLVGDPMQSIYGFRGAEVSLFLRAQSQGIAALSLDYKVLRKNFRTVSSLLSWSNQCFENLFPKKENMSTGAVCFTPSVAAKDITVHTVPAVPSYFRLSSDECQSNHQLLDYILKLQKQYPLEKIVVLARMKAHLKGIEALLQEADVPFYTPETSTLYDIPAVRDALNVLRACFDHEDRLAWSAFLRSPLVGLNEAELLEVANPAFSESLWECCQKLQEKIPKLQDVVPHLQGWMEKRGQLPLREWLSGVWFVLGGSALCPTEKSRLEFERFLQILAEVCSGEWIDEVLLKSHLQSQGLSLGAEDAPLQLMTIHKAKGLEFDHVILIKTEGQTRTEVSPLFHWTEMIAKQKNHFILFPKQRRQEEDTSWYRFIGDYLSEKEQYEQLRLFYVAVTRAKQTMSFFTQLPEGIQPKARTFASYLRDLAIHTYPEVPVRHAPLPKIPSRIVRTMLPL